MLVGILKPIKRRRLPGLQSRSTLLCWQGLIRNAYIFAALICSHHNCYFLPRLLVNLIVETFSDTSFSSVVKFKFALIHPPKIRWRRRVILGSCLNTLTLSKHRHFIRVKVRLRMVARVNW